jgi:hypothetical protein
VCDAGLETLQEMRGSEGGGSAFDEAAPSQEAVTAQLAESRAVLQSLQVLTCRRAPVLASLLCSMSLQRLTRPVQPVADSGSF